MSLFHTGTILISQVMDCQIGAIRKDIAKIPFHRSSYIQNIYYVRIYEPAKHFLQCSYGYACSNVELPPLQCGLYRAL